MASENREEPAKRDAPGTQPGGTQPGPEVTQRWIAPDQGEAAPSGNAWPSNSWHDRIADRQQQRWERRRERGQRRQERWQHRMDGWEARRHDWERGRRWDSIAWGLLLVLVGAVLLADRVDPRVDIAHTWPILIVGFGAILVVLSLVRGFWDE